MAVSRTIARVASRSLVSCPSARAVATASVSRSLHFFSCPSPTKRDIRPRHLPTSAQQIRRHSSPSKSRNYSFEEIERFSSSPSPDRVLVDVREPAEYVEGFIPGAVNLPIRSQPDAILMPADEFEDKFGFAKPRADQEVIFYCKAGVRGSAAANLAEQAGYQKIGEYRGSWLDWEKQGGQVAK